MSNGSTTTWSTPFSDEDRLAFIDDVAEDPAFGEAANIEEVTLHWDVDFLETDIGSINQELIVDIMVEAAAALDNSFETRMTQDPRLDGSNKVPGAMRILVGGVGARCSIAVTDALLASVVGVDIVQVATTAIQNALDESILRFTNGSVRRFENTGDETFSYGASRTATAQGLSLIEGEEAFWATGNLVFKDRGWKRLKPFEVGVDQQMSFEHIVNRATAWPTGFRVRYMLPSLIARVK
jgi:hypothetical protein